MSKSDRLNRRSVGWSVSPVRVGGCTVGSPRRRSISAIAILAAMLVNRCPGLVVNGRDCRAVPLRYPCRCPRRQLSAYTATLSLSLSLSVDVQLISHAAVTADDFIISLYVIRHRYLFPQLDLCSLFMHFTASRESRETQRRTSARAEQSPL